MTRIFLFIAVLFLNSSCVSVEQSQAFIIYSSTGEVYLSNSISKDLRKRYSLQANPALLILLTDTLENKDFRAQLNVLGQVNAETYEYIYVIGSSEEKDTSGYHITTKEAAAMLSGKQFQINIFNNSGELIHSSLDVINEKELKSHLEQ